MSKAIRSFIVALGGVCFAAAASFAHAEIYKWTNDDGTTTYSNQPPADRSSVEDLTLVVPAENVIKTPQRVEPLRIEPQRAEPAAAEPPKIVVEPSSPKTNTEPARGAVRPMLPQAVQDPCLRSSDRFCHEKHKDHYRPYVGYTPEPARTADTAPVAAPARGATSGGSAGGAVGGGARLK